MEKERKSIVSLNLKISLINELDNRCEMLGKNRGEFISEVLQNYFFSLNKTKPTTLQESVIRWLVYGEWVEPIKKE